MELIYSLEIEGLFKLDNLYSSSNLLAIISLHFIYMKLGKVKREFDEDFSLLL